MNLPNKLTVLRMLMIPLFLICMEVPFEGRYLWALVLFALASFTDLLDGKIARARGLVTDFGKLMDPLADKLLVMAAMVSLITKGMVPAVFVIVILAREFLVTSVRLVAAGKGTVLAADIWGKIKTALQMVWICLRICKQGAVFYNVIYAAKHRKQQNRSQQNIMNHVQSCLVPGLVTG